MPFDWTYDSGGIIWTAIFNYAVPTLFIALGVAARSRAGKALGRVHLQADRLTQWSKCLALRLRPRPRGRSATWCQAASASIDVMAAMANLAGALMLLGAIRFDSECAGGGTSTSNAGLKSAAEDAEPFLGWAALAIGAAADVASMVETTVEVASSPATMAVSVERTLDVQLTVTPDPDHDKGTVWPQTATHYVISVTYDDGPVYYYDGEPLPPPGQCPDSALGTCINHKFYAGLLRPAWEHHRACLLLLRHRLAGRPGELQARLRRSAAGLRAAPWWWRNLRSRSTWSPLSATTTYTMKEKLSFGPQGRGWSAPPAASVPTATVSDLDGSNVGNNLWQPSGELGDLERGRNPRSGIQALPARTCRWWTPATSPTAGSCSPSRR